MKFVCNTSPLIFLAKLNVLRLLKGHTLFLPLSVRDELLSKESGEKDLLAAFFSQKNVFILIVSY